MKNTFVISVEEDVATFLDEKIRQGAADDANTIITRTLQAEKDRQEHDRPGSGGVYPQDLSDLMANTPDAAH